LADRPTTGHTSAFRPGMVRAEADGRMYSAVFEKNAKPVIDGLSPFLADRSGTALEIGSGTGQHIIAFAKSFPNLTWVPSEPDAVHRASIDAWRVHLNAKPPKRFRSTAQATGRFLRKLALSPQ